MSCDINVASTACASEAFAVIEKKLVEGICMYVASAEYQPSVWCSAAHPSRLHLLPNPNRLYHNLSVHALQKKHVHAGSDHMRGLSSWDRLALWPRGQLRSIW